MITSCIESNATIRIRKNANHFNNGVAIVVVDDKYGLINTNGDFVIEPIYDTLGEACKCSSQCEDVVFKGKVTIAEKNDKHGIIDIKGNTIIDFENDIIEWETDYNCWYIYDGITYRYVDLNGKIISDDELKSIKIKKYEDDDGIYYTNHKQEIQHNRHKNEQLYYKYLNLATKANGNEYYSDITFMNNDFAVMKRVKKHEYNECEYIHKYNQCEDEYSMYGIIDINGNVIQKPIYDYIYKFEEGRAKVKKDNKFGIINTKGEVIIEPIYDFISDFNEGIAKIAKNDNFGIINIQGDVIVEPIYDSIEDFKEGMAIVSKVNKGFLRFGVINTKGEVIIEPTYGSIEGFSEGLAHYINDGQKGYMDKSGKSVFTCDFSGVYYEFHEGLAGVDYIEQNEINYRYINKNGDIVINLPLNSPEDTDTKNDVPYDFVITSRPNYQLLNLIIISTITVLISFTIIFVLKKVYKIYILFIIMYIMQFIVMPISTPRYYPDSNEASCVLLIPIVALIIFGMIFISDKIKHWLLSNILYLLLIWIYPSEGAYNIGMVGFAFAGTQQFEREAIWFGLVILAIFILLLEITIKGLIMIFKKFKRN